MNYLFSTTMKVRDYECDIQGVVNNANYQHYLEVTRHEWLNSIGESFSAWHDAGVDCMVSRVEIDYKTPLHPQETFESCLNLHREGARFVFDQDLYRTSDHRLCVHARVHVFSLVNGRLSRGEELANRLSQYLPTDF